MRRVLIGALVIVLALGLAGCESIGEEVGEEIAGGVVGADVEVDGDTVTIETEDGAVTVEGDTGRIPEDFPADFPIYDDAEVDSTSNITSDGDITYYLGLTSSDGVGEIYDWYKAEFADEGWELKSDVKLSGADGDSAMIGVEKGRMEGTLTLTAADGGTEIGIILLVED